PLRVHEAVGGDAPVGLREGALGLLIGRSFAPLEREGVGDAGAEPLKLFERWLRTDAHDSSTDSLADGGAGAGVRAGAGAGIGTRSRRPAQTESTSGQNDSPAAAADRAV